MEVICISSKWPKHFSIGSRYIVTETYSSIYKGKKYWYHKFAHTGPDIGFRVENFAIVSEIDERESVEAVILN